MNRPRVLHGRLRVRHRRDRARHHLPPRVSACAPATRCAPCSRDPTRPLRAEGQTLRVSGVIAIQGGFPPISGGLPPLALLSNEYYRAHPQAYSVYMVRLRDGSRGVAQVHAQARGTVAGRAGRNEQPHRDDRAGTTRSRRAGDGAAAPRVRCRRAHGRCCSGRRSPASRRWRPTTTTCYADWASRTRSLRARAFGRGIAIGIAAAVVATITAVLLSLLTPVGVGRQAELHPGYRRELRVSRQRDWPRCSSSSCSSRPSPRCGPRRRGAAREYNVGRRQRRRTCRRRARVGRRFDGRGGRRAHGARTGPRTHLGAGAIDDHQRDHRCRGDRGRARLLRVVARACCDEPRLYGWNWDIQIGDLFAPDLRPQAEAIAARPEADAVSVATIVRLHSGSELFDTLAIEPLKGSTRRRWSRAVRPRRRTRSCSGTRTLEDLHRKVGDRIVRLGRDTVGAAARRRSRCAARSSRARRASAKAGR